MELMNENNLKKLKKKKIPTYPTYIFLGRNRKQTLFLSLFVCLHLSALAAKSIEKTISPSSCWYSLESHYY